MTQRFDLIEGLVESLAQTTAKNFDRADQHLEKIESRLEGVENKIEGIGRRIDHEADQRSQLAQRVEKLEQTPV